MTNKKAIVVGLGPAGAAALRRLEELGVDSLGIERKSVPGKPVVCGEYIPEADEISFITRYSSLRKAYNYIGLAPKLCRSNRIEVDINGEYILDLSIKGYTIDRAKMIENLLEGTYHILGDAVRKVIYENNVFRIMTKEGREFTAKYIIAADGSPSFVAQSLGIGWLWNSYDVAIGVNVRMYTPSMPQDAIFMYISPRYTPGGYAWIIPRGNYLSNVGVGIRLNYIQNGVNPVSLLKDIIRINPRGYLTNAKTKGKILGRWIPVGGVRNSLTYCNVIFVGDAAGMVNPINGGGIPTAMASGIIAAEAIYREDISLFEKRIKEEIKPAIDIGLSYRRIVDFAYNNWWVTKIMLNIVPKRLATKILKGEPTFLSSILK